MATAYNIRQALDRGARAEVQELPDPGSGGTISLGDRDLAVIVVTGAGARTLESATTVPLGTRLLVLSQTDAITVNSVTINDGQAAEFRVTLNNAGVRQWVNTLPPIPANIELELSALAFRVHDAPASFLTAGAGANDDLGVTIGTYGMSRPSLNATVDDASATQYGRVPFTVPSDYSGGDITVTASVTRTAAADTSATIDLEAYRLDAPSVDICATAAIDINATATTTAAFTLTGTAVQAGDVIDLRYAVAIDDSAGASAPAVFEITHTTVTYARS